MSNARAWVTPILAAVALAATWLAVLTPAFAETRFTRHGAPGNAGIDLKCPPEMYIMNVVGQTGAWIDNVRIQCGRMTAEGRVGSDWISPPIGGSGGGYNNARCPNGTAVSAIEIMLTDDKRQVFSIGPTCYGVFNGATALPRGDSGGVTFGGTWTKPSGGFFSGVSDRPAQSSVSHACPGGELATGLSLRYGVHVNAVALICNTIVKAAAPAPPPKPIKSTGKARPSGSAGTLGFAGTWKTVTSSGGHFALTFQIAGAPMAGQPLQFTGVFVNTDGSHQYDGTLQGTAMFPVGTLNYTYTQPGIQAAGTGYFALSSDGKSITGQGLHMGKDKFDWNGTR